jgi:hypothetical protein
LKLQKFGAAQGCFEYVLKTKGITLDFDACQKITFDEVKRRVLAYGEEEGDEEPISLNYKMIRPNASRGVIHTVNFKKKYRVLITKGIVLGDFKVVPFGYFNPRNITHSVAYSNYIHNLQ